MTRINDLNMSLLDIMVALADGNPGAVSAMMEMVKAAEKTDPDSALGPFVILSLDTHEIYGPDIWVLFKDICGQSPVRMLAVLRAVQLGITSESEIKAAIRDWRLPDGRVDWLQAKVQEQLPRFAATSPTPTARPEASKSEGEE